MRISREIFSKVSLGTKNMLHQLKYPNEKISVHTNSNRAGHRLFSARPYTVNHLSRNLHLITIDKDVRLEQVKDVHKKKKPLVIMLPWLMAKPTHVMKYADIYIDQGFDVLTARITHWQMLWPETGAKVVANELVDFLHDNCCYEPMLIHGFSVGAYLWGEVCLRLEERPELYQPIVDRIVGQVWDSVPDVQEVHIGFPLAVFPRNRAMRSIVAKCFRLHMRIFHEEATIHYIRSSKMFHNNVVTAPAMFLLSKTDPVGTEESAQRYQDSWVARGVQTYWKCWDSSPHVGHFRKHPMEYKALLYAFLTKLNLIQHPEETRAKLEL